MCTQNLFNKYTSFQSIINGNMIFGEAKSNRNVFLTTNRLDQDTKYYNTYVGKSFDLSTSIELPGAFTVNAAARKFHQKNVFFF